MNRPFSNVDDVKWKFRFQKRLKIYAKPFMINDGPKFCCSKLEKYINRKWFSFSFMFINRQMVDSVMLTVKY